MWCIWNTLGHDDFIKSITCWLEIAYPCIFIYWINWELLTPCIFEYRVIDQLFRKFTMAVLVFQRSQKICMVLHETYQWQCQFCLFLIYKDKTWLGFFLMIVMFQQMQQLSCRFIFRICQNHLEFVTCYGLSLSVCLNSYSLPSQSLSGSTITFHSPEYFGVVGIVGRVTIILLSGREVKLWSPPWSANGDLEATIKVCLSVVAHITMCVCVVEHFSTKLK